MKTHTLSAVCLALVAVHGFQHEARGQTTNVTAVPTAVSASPAGTGTNLPPVVAVPPVPQLPPPVAEVVQLVRRGIGEAVITDFIGQIREPFSLDADQLIYLNDLGIGGPVLQALLKKAASLPAEGTAVQNVVVQNGPQVAPTPTGASPDAPTPASTTGTSGPKENVLLNPYLASTASAPGPAGQAGATQAGDVPQAPAGTAPAAAPTQPVVVTHQIFYESLSPYGTWVEVPSYGWCWQPTVAVCNSTWIPYGDGGRWVWTDTGWYWHSTYTWGWAPYHYGRWHRHSRHGWVWIPGYDWGPAWVAWRSTPTYCGWAPLPPECHWRSGIGFRWTDGRTSLSVGFGIGNDWWFATTWNRFCDPVRPIHRIPHHSLHQFVHDSRFAVGGGNTVNIRGNNNTVIINNGVSREEVQRHTRQEIRRTEIRDAASPAAAHAFATSARPSPGGNVETVAAFRPTLPPQASKPSASALAKPGLNRGATPGFQSPSPSAKPGPSSAVSTPGHRGPTGSWTPPTTGAAGSPRPAPAPLTGLGSTRTGTLSPTPSAGFGGGQVGRTAPLPQAPSPSTAKPVPSQAVTTRGEVFRPSTPGAGSTPSTSVGTTAPGSFQPSRPTTGFQPTTPSAGSFSRPTPSTPYSPAPTVPSPAYSKPTPGPTPSAGFGAKPNYVPTTKPAETFRPSPGGSAPTHGVSVPAAGGAARPGGHSGAGNGRNKEP